MPEVSVIIVNLNGEKHLEDCLLSLTRQDFQDFEVVFVDNGSSDGSIALALRCMPQIQLIALKENAGFAGGNNAGIRAAQGAFVVLLNNDTKCDAKFLAELVRAARQDSRIGMVAPKILNHFDRRVIDSVGGLLLSRDGIGQGRGRGELDVGQYDSLTEVLLPSGCAALYRKAMLEEIGLLEEAFFAYCEDTDLGLRALWAGWKAVAAPQAVVFHKYSATTSTYSSFKLFLVERNHYFVALRNFPISMLVMIPFWTLYRMALMAYAGWRGKGKGQAAAGGKIQELLIAFCRGNIEACRHGLGHLRLRPRRRRINNADFTRMIEKHRVSLAKVILGD